MCWTLNDLSVTPIWYTDHAVLVYGRRGKRWLSDAGAIPVERPLETNGQGHTRKYSNCPGGRKPLRAPLGEKLEVALHRPSKNIRHGWVFSTPTAVENVHQAWRRRIACTKMVQVSCLSSIWPCPVLDARRSRGENTVQH